MPSSNYSPTGYSPTSSRGVGLVELLIALAITSALLTATAWAVKASFDAYAFNQTEADLTHRARLTLHRLTTYVRSARDHAPATADAEARFAAGERVVDSGVALFTPEPDARDVVFRHDAASEEVRMTVDGGAPAVMLRGVTRFEVTLEPMRSPQSTKTGGGFDRLRRATILLTVRADPLAGEADGRTVTFSASVVPRANVW